MRKYITNENEMLDEIVFRLYGSINCVEHVLEENPNIADYGPILPCGIEIFLPEIKTKAKEIVRLWE